MEEPLDGIDAAQVLPLGGDDRDLVIDETPDPEAELAVRLQLFREGEAARTGAVPLVALMAAISLQLGIFNLVPIPVLDGGHLFLIALEGIVRRDFSLKVKERILQVGFLMILALITVVLYNDLAKNLPAKWWPF